MGEYPSLSPQVWHGTLSLLADADGAGEGATIDLGYDRLLLAWLGCHDPAECRERHGLTVAEVLYRDRGHLAPAARVVAGDRELTSHAEKEALVLLIKVWAERASRLAAIGEDVVSIASFDRAVAICPLPEDTVRALWTKYAEACEVHGNRSLAATARERLKALDEVSDDSLQLVVTLLFCVLWAMTHDEYLLRCENALDPHVGRSVEEWERIRLALAEGRLGDLPVPVQTFCAWCPGPGLEEDDLRGCIGSSTPFLPELVATVEAVLSGTGEPGSLSPTHVALVVEICRMRRIRIERDYEPVPGERLNIYYELQGARRPEVIERLDLMRRLNGLLARYGMHVPDIRMCVALDLAAEAESRGDHDVTRQHLEELRRAAVLVDDAGRREYAEVCLAQHCWQLGDVNGARAILADLTGEHAVGARQRFDALASAHTQHRAAVDACHRTPGIEAWSALADAELAAGHFIAGERTAQALTRAYPAQSLAWMTLARVLHEQGRHRDAIEPAREAVRLAGAGGDALELLDRILARIGHDEHALGSSPLRRRS